MAVAAIPYVVAGLAAASKIQQGQAEQQNLKDQAKAADYSAAVNRANAENILAASAANEDSFRRQSAAKLGQQRASLAENGISLTSGTGSDLTYTSALNAEMDALNLRYEGKLRAQDQLSQAALNDFSKSSLLNNKKRASNAMPLSVASSALSSYMGAKSGSY